MVRVLATAVAASLLAGPAGAAIVCTIAKRAELPVTMDGMRPLVHAAINGTDALFIADSGAFYSMLTPAAAAEFKLPLRTPPFGLTVGGVGGAAASTWVTTVRAFGIFNINLSGVEFLVAGNDFGAAVGLLGQNVLRLAGDVEYDLANGVIRLMSVKDCGKSALAYWAGSQPFSAVEIERSTPQIPHTRGTAFLNGQKIRVTFDTGASSSTLTLDAAKRAGITPQSPGVVPSGAMYGVGTRITQSWVATFGSFKIGDEEIRNARLRFGDFGAHTDMDMLLGADFFLSHRIYVANGQQKLYFTYNGGPVFNLTANPSAATATPPAGPAVPAPAANAIAGSMATASGAAAGGATAGADAAAAAPASETHGEQPTDASGFSRRGAAFAARHDFAHAIADFTRACELAPGEAGYFYQRGTAYVANGQPDLALADFDHALKLRPTDLPALVSRAELHLRQKDDAAALADLDVASQAAPREDPVHLQLGQLYLRAASPAAANAQFTDWIDTHSRSEVAMPHALAVRCWARALSATQLDAGLGDCNGALRSSKANVDALTGRGLIWLRRGDNDKAIADFDRALALRDDAVWARYCRGVANLRKGRAAEGQSDIATATSRDSHIAERAARFDIRA